MVGLCVGHLFQLILSSAKLTPCRIENPTIASLIHSTTWVSLNLHLLKPLKFAQIPGSVYLGVSAIVDILLSIIMVYLLASRMADATFES